MTSSSAAKSPVTAGEAKDILPFGAKNAGEIIRRSCAIWAFTAALTLAGGGAAVAQTRAPCEGLSSLAANAHLQVTEQYGRALIEIARPGNMGHTVDIEYGNELYSVKFSPESRVRVGIPMTAQTNEITIHMPETAAITCTVAVPDFTKLYRVILRWHDPVQLDLNVIEPGGRTGESGHINTSRPNDDLTQGIGMLDVTSGPPAEGATADISYVVPNPATIPPDGVFTYKLDYLTRGAQPVAPYCDNFPLAAPEFDFIVIDKGNVTTRKMTVNRERCHEAITDERRLMPIRG